MSDSSSSSRSTVSPQVLLATSAKDPDGEPAHEVLDAALAQRGITSAWAPWDDPFVDWSAADLVAVRSTWDHDTRRADFLGWAREVGPHLLHGPELFRWNTDKAYLLDLAGVSGLRVVPTVVADNLVDLRAAIGRVGTAVVKPRHGAGGRGIVIVRDSESWLPVDQGPWVVQPLLPNIQREGEVSVFVIGGRPVSQVLKTATKEDIRVNPAYGGARSAVPLDDAAAVVAVEAVAATSEVTGSGLAYARVDMIRHEGRLLVSEVEVTEPCLYLDVAPENAAALADVIAARLGV